MRIVESTRDANNSVCTAANGLVRLTSIIATLRVDVTVLSAPDDHHMLTLPAGSVIRSPNHAVIKATPCVLRLIGLDLFH